MVIMNMVLAAIIGLGSLLSLGGCSKNSFCRDQIQNSWFDSLGLAGSGLWCLILDVVLLIGFAIGLCALKPNWGVDDYSLYDANITLITTNLIAIVGFTVPMLWLRLKATVKLFGLTLN